MNSFKIGKIRMAISEPYEVENSQGRFYGKELLIPAEENMPFDKVIQKLRKHDLIKLPNI